MIAANELRIGNWVMYEGKPVLVATLFAGVEKEGEPIPLTPEVLEKCGFVPDLDTNKEREVDGVFELDVISLHQSYQTGIYYFVTEWQYDSIEKTIEVHYLHQLQNLYFALTGTELTIKQIVDVYHR